MSDLFNRGSNLLKNSSFTSSRCELVTPRNATSGVIPKPRSKHLARNCVAVDGLFIVIKNDCQCKFIEIPCGHNRNPRFYDNGFINPITSKDYELIDFSYFINVSKQFSFNRSRSTNKRLSVCLQRQ